MSITKQIYDLLKVENLTSNQIAEKLKIDSKETNIITVYLNRMEKARRIKKINKIGREYIYTINNQNDNLDIQTLNKIREMFEKGVIKVYKDKLTEEYKKILEEL